MFLFATCFIWTHWLVTVRLEKSLERNIFIYVWLHFPINMFVCKVSPRDVVVSGQGPRQRRVSGRGQWGGAHRLAAAHVGAYVVVLMWGIRWRNTHTFFSYFTILSYINIISIMFFKGGMWTFRYF